MKKILMVIMLVLISTTIFAGTHETITVSSSAIGISADVKSPSGQANPTRCLLTLETASIRYWLDGTDPTSTVGHLLTAGQILILDRVEEIYNFKSIAVSGDATLRVSCDN